MNKKIATPLGILIIVLVIAVIIGVALWMCPEKENGTTQIPAEKYCEQDEDCACGINKTTGDCFYGNKDFVDVIQQCPDFCSGLAGNFVIKCMDNQCKQIASDSSFIEAKKGGQAENDLHSVITKIFCESDCVCYKVIEQWGNFLNANYETESTDLNDDEQDEIIVRGVNCVYQLTNIPIGGVTGNESYFILQKQNDGWVGIGSMSGAISIEKTKTNGYYDITNDSNMGNAGTCREVTHYEWDGSYYQVADSKLVGTCDF